MADFCLKCRQLSYDCLCAQWQEEDRQLPLLLKRSVELHSKCKSCGCNTYTKEEKRFRLCVSCGVLQHD